MKVVYHPAVQKDLNGILQYYEDVSPKLGDEFWQEFSHCIEEAATNPERFHPVTRDLRRVNLKRFPHHFLFRILSGKIRVVLLKHHQRNPRFGLGRR